MLPNEKRIQTKAQLKDWLDFELPRYSKSFIHNVLLDTEGAILRRHQLLLRKAEYYSNNGKRLIARIYVFRLLRMQNRHALHIPLNCCGRGLKIMHLGPILVNSGAQLGERCSLHINTGIVAGGRSSAAPVLEDGVVVGFGAVIVGNVHIAKNVAIGANAVVNRDVLEENIAVAGVPAKKISDNGRLSWGKGDTK